MKCVLCKHGETSPGVTTVTLERGQTTLVVHSVPAEVCEECGEQYVCEGIASKLLRSAEEAVRNGVRVEIREWSASPMLAPSIPEDA
ncbi:MAG TPA: type II toxin-antitoxin system MqsA family antitoxin [bacterium]|nr:type II toxin-antitoxin system MqsA family antitoxin [bacterium]HQL63973.1 type II toxin-antitoxin system MqsA family antitoxin [bacterium]